MNQPGPDGVHDGFQKEDHCGLERRHVTHGAREQEIGQADLHHAEVQDHSQVGSADGGGRQGEGQRGEEGQDVPQGLLVGVKIDPPGFSLWAKGLFGAYFPKETWGSERT
jgi:hypothetical protein